MTPKTDSHEGDPGSSPRSGALEGSAESASPGEAGFLESRSPAFQDFAEKLRRAALSEATVVLQGPSGAGKSEAARALHRLSPRAAGPFLEVALAALSPTLLEAALFGHEEGAFTGAHRAREGCFVRAAGGTVVLDGVEALPLELQGKLLRVLQERRVLPLGAEAEIEIEARVVATSTSDLAQLVERGEFREDLYFRLAVLSLDVPALRLRTEDLPALCQRISERLVERDGLRSRPLSEAALERLAEHAWPGNVRELENALARVLVLVPDEEDPSEKAAIRLIEPAEFKFLDEAIEGEIEALARKALAFGFTLEEIEQALITVALKESRGVVSAAARSVGLTRRAFEYRRSRLAKEASDAGGEDS